MLKRVLLAATFLVALFFCGWGLVENAWIASFKGPYRQAFAQRAEVFGIGLLIRPGSFAVFGCWALSLWMVRSLRQRHR
jgi:hypothetical protein